MTKTEVKYIIYDNLTRRFFSDSRYVSPAMKPKKDYLHLYFYDDITCAMIGEENDLINYVEYWRDCHVVDRFTDMMLDVSNFVIKKITITYDE